MKKTIFFTLGFFFIFVPSQFCDSQYLSGKYINSINHNAYIEFNKDGTFYAELDTGIRGWTEGVAGKYQVDKNLITFVLGDGRAWRAKIEGDTIKEDGQEWIKESVFQKQRTIKEVKTEDELSEGILKERQLLAEKAKLIIEAEKQKASLSSPLPKIEGHWDMMGFQLYFSSPRPLANSQKGSIVIVLPDFTSNSSFGIYNAEKMIEKANDKKVQRAIINQIEFMKKYSGKTFIGKYEVYGRLENNPRVSDAERLYFSFDFNLPPQDSLGQIVLSPFPLFLSGGNHVLYVYRDGTQMACEAGYLSTQKWPLLEMAIKYVDAKTAPEDKK